MAYFLLKHVNLSREDRRQILLANQSDYTVEGIEKALRVSYFDHHERERRVSSDWNQSVRRPKGRGRGHRSYAVADEEAFDGDEAYDDDEMFEEAYAADDAEAPEENDMPDDEPSDRGASEDDEIYEAFAAMDQHRKTYQESRQKLKQIQRNRGYFKGDISGQIKGEISYEERQKAIQKEKSRTRCAACDRLGHWAGDAICPKASSHQGPRRSPGKGGRGPKKGQGRGRSAGRAYLVGESPLYFSVSQSDGTDEEHCNMVGSKSEESEMEQDSGFTETDSRRKVRAPAMTEGAISDWEAVSDVSQGYAAQSTSMTPWVNDSSQSGALMSGEEVLAEITTTKKVLARDVTDLQVPSLAGVMPDDLGKMKVRDLQAECDNWGIQCSGNRGELLDRLVKLFNGDIVLKKGCTTKFIRLVEASSSAAAGSDGPLVLPKAKSRPEKKVIPEPKHGSSPPASDQQEAADSFQKLSDERIFRRNLDSRLAAAALVQSETPQKDPRSGMGVPPGMEVGRSSFGSLSTLHSGYGATPKSRRWWTLLWLLSVWPRTMPWHQEV